MKNIYKISSALLALSTLWSCVDLNTAPLSTTITSDQKSAAVTADPSKAEASVAAIASSFLVYGGASGGSGSDQHNDFGYPSVMMFLDTRGQDMIGFDIVYNWFSYGITYSDVQSNGWATSITWTNLYNQIFATNAVIGAIDPETEIEQSQYYLAQALAVRAFDYFNLAQIYAYTYVGHEQDPCVPIITNKNADEAAAQGCECSSVEKVYEQVLEDIDAAIALLEKCGVKPSDKRYVSIAAAHGIRARIYQVMNKWPESLEDAKAAIAAFEGAPASLEEASHPAFIDIDDHNWMWGVLITDKDRCSTTGICNFASQMGSLNYGYAGVGAWRLINKKLFASIAQSDIRRGWFLDENGESKNLTAAEQGYCNANQIPPYTQVKYAPAAGELGGSDNDNDVPLMRIEEMYLIKAEAEIMSGDKGTGLQTLTDFVKTYRDPSFATNGDDAQDQVWHQRRLEFWGEGISWFDIMRLKKGFDRRGCGWPATGVFNFAPEAAEFLFPIPYDEVQHNPKIAEHKEAAVPKPIPDVE